MKRFFSVVGLLLLTASSLEAQTTQTFSWDYDRLPTEVATYTQTARVDNVAVTGTPTCIPKVGTPTHTTCSIPIPTLTAGSHTLSVTAERNGVTAETRLTGVNPSNGPGSAQNPRISITVIVTVP